MQPPPPPACVPPQCAYQLLESDLPSFDLAAARLNPLKGMTVSPEWSTPPYLDSVYSSLEYYYIGLNDVMSSMTNFDGLDMHLEPKLSDSASRHKHAILRVILDYPELQTMVPQFLIDGGLTMTDYTDHSNEIGQSQSPDYSDPNLIAALEAFIAEFGRRYDGDARIGFIQVGLLGFWGEWHTFPHSDWLPASTKDTIVSAFDAAFDQTQLQVRVPWPSAVSLERPFGLHDDSFAYSTLDGDANGGDDAPWFFWPSVVAAGADAVWRTGAMGGELRPELQAEVFNDDYPAGTAFKQDYTACTEATHATYMLNHYAFSTGYTGSALQRAVAASDRMGYAFVVSAITVGQPTIEAMSSVAVTVTQKGVAPFYYPLALTLSCPGTETRTTDGVEDIIAEGEAVTFGFMLPARRGCLEQVSVGLQSPMAYAERPVVFAQGDGSVVVDLSSAISSGVCPDVTGDEIVGTDDLLFVLAVWGREPAEADTQVAAADFNGDGAVNADDLLVLLARFGQTC